MATSFTDTHQAETARTGISGRSVAVDAPATGVAAGWLFGFIILSALLLFAFF
jgi:hypothetical protein